MFLKNSKTWGNKMEFFKFGWVKFIASLIIAIFAYYFSMIFVTIGPSGGYTLEGYILVLISILVLIYVIIISVAGIYNKLRK